MKRSIGRLGRRVSVSACCIVFAAWVGQGASQAGIRDSAHDFSAGGHGGPWGSATEERLCVFCHTPHEALPSQTPLWNREYTGGTYEIYGSATLDAQIGQPSASSRLCLSCHDGSVAIDAYATGGPSTPQMMSIGDVYYPGSPYGEGGPNIGGSYAGLAIAKLTDDHPISFVYDALLASKDGDLRPPSELPAWVPLFNGRLECSTCHDVHNTLEIKSLLRRDNSGSALCLSCHIK